MKSENYVPLLCLCIALLACSQPEHLASAPEIDPRNPTTDRVLVQPVPLTPMILQSQTDFDRWEHVIMERSGPTMVYLLYKRLVVHGLKRDQKPGYEAIRWLIMGYREPLPKQVRQELRGVASRMAQEKTLNPNVQYLVGLMAWTALVERPDQTDIPNSLDKDSYIDVVVSNWTRLGKESPNWIGPFGLTSAELSARAQQLEQNRSVASSKTLQKALAQEAFAAAQTLNAQETAWLNALDGFYREIEDKGIDKACVKVLHADKGEASTVFLGDAVTLCALHRGQVDKALKQIEQMLEAKAPGAIRHLLLKITERGKPTAEQLARIKKLREKLMSLAQADPEYGRKCGVVSENTRPL